jgi:Ca2+-binding EF-hand superfamily protein
LERIFEECITYDGEIDFKTYVDLIIAMENKKEPQSVAYFFKFLDINGEGFLDTLVLYHFFKALQATIKDGGGGQEAIDFYDVRDEIFDVVKPSITGKITVTDLINCGQGDVVITLLTDAGGFFGYDTRELSVPDLPAETEV